ncbi:MoaC family protein [Helicosporidium sp. ATCC 50920]|nr:MoaC family protein [Helicosporidium sp. ATCC 50920]|eukprot:KDD76135.1 MoaC family protein [Helicosporidium sp. ATCC 50920]
MGRSEEARTEHLLASCSLLLPRYDALASSPNPSLLQKADTKRTAVAVASVAVGPVVGSLIRANQVQKGDVLSVARLAGIMAAKLTPQLIPLCHPILLSSARVELQLDERAEVVEVQATAATKGGTGVEMEAMVAAAVAALTVYDMCKAASKHIVISQVKLRSKTGGKSGDWHRDE